MKKITILFLFILLQSCSFTTKESIEADNDELFNHLPTPVILHCKSANNWPEKSSVSLKYGKMGEIITFSNCDLARNISNTFSPGDTLRTMPWNKK